MRCWAFSPCMRSARSGCSTRMSWRMSAGRCCGPSARGCRSIASAAPISSRHFRRSRPPRSRQILRGVWDNLGRVGAEFAHIDRLWDYDREHGRGRILDSDESRDDRDPAARRRQAGAGLCRASGELGARRRRPARLRHRQHRAVPPAERARHIGRRHRDARRLHGHADADQHGRAGQACRRAGARLARRHAGRSVCVQGVPVTFFGRRTRANALIARLARQIECPIHGMRVVRYPRRPLPVAS